MKKFIFITMTILMCFTLFSCNQSNIENDDFISSDIENTNFNTINTELSEEYPPPPVEIGFSHTNIVFRSIEDFEKAAKNGELGKLDFYYYPQNVSKEAIFEKIELNSEYIAFFYTIPNNMLTIKKISDEEEIAIISINGEKVLEVDAVKLYEYGVDKSLTEEIVYQMYTTQYGKEYLDGFLEYAADSPDVSVVKENNNDLNDLLYSDISTFSTNMSSDIDITACYSYFYTVDNTMMFVRIPAIIPKEEAPRYTELVRVDIR